MKIEQMNNNRVFLSGTVQSEPIYSHETYGEAFYEITLLVPRLSNHLDRVPVTVSEKLIASGKFELGKYVCIKGQFRSYNKLENGKSKLMLTVFVREICDFEEDMNPNVIEITGYICKEPTYRTTPFNREIADVLIAVNRAYNKSDYIPCIAWGRNARFVKNLSVGEKIAISGRIQSREYQKKLSESETRLMTAYEVSVSKLAAFDNVDNFDLEREFDLEVMALEKETV